MARKRGHGGREGARPPRKRTSRQYVRSTVRSILRGPDHPYVAELRRHTPSTGHMCGDAKRMVREVENWPASWAPAKLREKLVSAIRRDPYRTYVYYPLGSHRPNVQHRQRRYSVEEFAEHFDRRRRRR